MRSKNSVFRGKEKLIDFLYINFVCKQKGWLGEGECRRLRRPAEREMESLPPNIMMFWL